MQNKTSKIQFDSEKDDQSMFKSIIRSQSICKMGVTWVDDFVVPYPNHQYAI